MYKTLKKFRRWNRNGLLAIAEKAPTNDSSWTVTTLTDKKTVTLPSPAKAVSYMQSKGYIINPDDPAFEVCV